jgi:hypothetical protein
MKKKNVLRLLAFVMAASLTLTSAPAGLLSGTETVAAAQADTLDPLEKDDLIITATSISVKQDKSPNTKQFLLVAAGQGDIDPDDAANEDNWITGTGSGDTLLSLSHKSGNANTVDDAANGTQILMPNHTYYVYQRTKADGTTAASKASKVLTVTTNKISLVDATVTIAADPNTTNTSVNDMVYKGDEIKPVVTKITLKDGTNLTGDALSNVEVTYKNNINVGSKTDTNDKAPTVTVTGIGDYEGSASVKFNIIAYSLEDNIKKVRVTIDGVVSDSKNGPTLTYTGLQQTPTIKVEAQLDPNSTKYTELKEGTDYAVDLESSTNSNTTDSKANGTGDGDINYNIDAGKVAVVLTGVGNFEDNAAGSYEIKKATPNAPTAPKIKDITAYGFTIDTSTEDARYSYQYLILEKNDTTNIKWGDVDAVTDSSNDGIADDYASAGFIVSVLATTTGDTTTTMTKPNITLEFDGTDTVVSDGTNTINSLTVPGSTDKQQLIAGKTYYVVRRIISDTNTSVSGVSAVTEVTLAPTDLNNVILATGTEFKKDGAALGYSASASGIELPDFNKTYNAKPQSDVEVVLYDNTYNTLAVGTYNVISDKSYTIEYYNDKNIASNKSAKTGVKGDVTSAGTVYVYAEGDGKSYSGKVYLGYYTISKKAVNAVVNNGSKTYDSTTTVYPLSADVKTGLEGSDSVHVEGLTGTLAFAAAGTQKVTKVTTTNNTKITGTGSENYELQYYVSSASVTVSKATVSIKGGSSIDVYFDRTTNLKATFNTGITDIDSRLHFALGKTSTDLTNKLTLTDDGELKFLDYDSLKDIASSIQVIITYDVQDTKSSSENKNNYTLSDASGKTITLNLKKAPTVVQFRDPKVIADTTTEYGFDNTAAPIVYFPSYVRPATIQAVVENSSSNEAGIIKADGSIVASENTNGASIKLETDDENEITYVYCYSDGTPLSANYPYPSKDGTYLVKAYIKCKDDNVTPLHVDDSQVAGTLTLVIGSKKDTVADDTTDKDADDEELTDESRAKGYEVVDGKLYTIADGKLVRSEFQYAENLGYIVYANKNGVMVHGKTFKAADGYWHYAHEDGSVETTKGIKNTDDNGKVYCTGTNKGKLLVNGSKVVSGERYVANSKGKLVKKGFFTTKKGYTYYLTNYKAIKNKAFTDTDGKTYVANKNGTIQKGKKIVTVNGKSYYVGAKGVVAKNKVVTVSGKKYVANAKGVIVKNGKYTIGKKTYTTNKKGVITKTTTKK